ncbi:uncharacterized protein TNCV_4352091 [Trichonephila clavipes]|nr:uncharacterized protein TNCV_4352091 [Trichonephila clavipes]
MIAGVLQGFWVTFGNFFQRLWNTVLDLSGSDEYVIGVYGTFLHTTLVYWIAALSYTAINLTGKPTLAFKYKIQDTSSQVSTKEVLKAIKQVFFNQVVIGIPFILAVHHLRDGAQFLFTPINKSSSEIKEIILDVRFPKQKNRRVIFQSGDGVQLTSEHVVLFKAILPPQIRPKIGRKNCVENVRVIRPLVD